MLFVFFCQVRYKLGLSDDEEDEIDSADQPRSDKDLCHPLCQCEKCSKWQKVCDVTARHAKYRLGSMRERTNLSERPFQMLGNGSGQELIIVYLEKPKQEPITINLQLPHIPVTAFSQTDLFLV